MGFFRGADFSESIGTSDWRIALYMPEYGFESWVFGKGEYLNSKPLDVHIVNYNPSFLPWPASIHMSSQFFQQASGLDLDVIICNPSLALAGAVIKKTKPSTKIIIDIRSIPVEINNFLGFFHKLYFYLSIRYRFYDAVSIISQGMLDDIDSKYQLWGDFPMVVWGSGFDPALFNPSIDGAPIRQEHGWIDKFVVMFHGTLSPSRGLAEVLQSLRVLIDLGEKDIYMVFIGHGDARDDLIRLARKLSINNHVRFMPPVSHVNIPSLIAACDIGIDPLPDHHWWRHQSALKVFEYLAMGKPVLATNIPCHHELSDAVLIVPDNSPQSLAQGVLDYRRLSALVKSNISELAKADAAQFTWKARAGILAEFIRKQILQ